MVLKTVNQDDPSNYHLFYANGKASPGSSITFEIATEVPGYKSVTDNENKMGKELFLPPWLESKRNQIENKLPQIKI